MFRTFVVAAFLTVSAGTVAVAGQVLHQQQPQADLLLTVAPHQALVTNRLSSNKLATNKLATNKLATNKLATNKLATNKLATNKLATNRLAGNQLATNRIATNKLATNGLPLGAVSLAPTEPGDVTPLVTVVAVTLADGTHLELPAAR